MKKYVYSFNEGSKDMRSLLGGKGANLAEMTRIGLPVPFGFTITTEACNRYYDEGQTIAQDLIDAIYEKIAELEEVSGKTFGSNENPLLVSVRSGAVISMPGMMDTILNLGLNDQSVEGLAALTENRRFAMDSYRRFIQMFGDVVQEIPKAKFDKVFDGQKAARGVKFDVDLTAEDLEQVIEGYKQIVKEETGKDFPQDPKEQLIEAVKAVFRSWNNDRAILYRNLNGIAHDLGTAVNVQSMVFGNMGDTSGTGVAFTRNPADGTNEIFGEFLVNAQGEDVVAGVRTPMNIKKMADAFPQAYSDFIKIADLLEKHYKDVQDMEFTVERGKLYMLQTRSGKRTAQAAVKIAVDMVGEGLIDKKTAVTRLEPEQIDQLRGRVDEEHLPVLCIGLRTDFLTHLFPGSLRLFELADSITEIKTICECGSKATVNARISHTGRVITHGAQVFLGGSDSYVAMCHACWKKRIAKERQEAGQLAFSDEKTEE